MAVFLVERGVLAAKIETVKGTANAPVAVDGGLEISDVSLNTDITVVERDPIAASFDDPKAIRGNRISRVTFKSPIVGGTTAGSRPPHWALLRACGMTEAISAGVSVTYTPTTASSTQETVTIDLYLDGILHRIVGAMGTFRKTVAENDTPMFEFEFHGVYVAPSDTALLSGVAYQAVSPPAPLGATLTFRSQTLVSTGWTFDLANSVVVRQDITQAGGVIHAVITNRKPVITTDPEVELVATFDFWSNVVNANSGEFNGTIGSAAGNTVRLLAPNAEITTAEPGDREGLRILNLTLKPRRLVSAGEDHASLRYT